MSGKTLLLIPLVSFAGTYLLVHQVLTSSATPAAETPAPVAASTKEPAVISDPTQVPELAEAPGKDAFVANCMNCHSVRYVLMQPKFPRKVWTAEVTKMVQAYKAKIDPAQQAEIVNYLVAAYGSDGGSS